MAIMIQKFIASKLVYAMALLWLITLASHYLEPVFMPVVTHFNVETISRDKQVLTLSGSLIKARPKCQFAGVTVKLEDSDAHLTLVFRDNRKDDTATRPEGYQVWGPWTVELPPGHESGVIIFTSLHRCHPGWATATPLTRISVTTDN